MNDLISNDSNTEVRILLAAKEIFLQKGIDGARMQEIADKAGINKALLHYYYRSKEKLFNTVFEQVIGDFIPRMVFAISSDKPLFTKIEEFVAIYLELLEKNPFVPQFIISELNRNPDKIVSLIGNKGLSYISGNFWRLEKQIEEEYKKGVIERIDPPSLIINMLSLCIFPILSGPIVTAMLFKGDHALYNSFLEERKKEVPRFIINSIRKK